MRHELKTDPQPFDDVWKGTKLYEIRKDDRVRVSDDPNAAYNVGFQVGDELLLKETKYTGKQMAGGRQLEYTGREILCEVMQKLAGPVYGLESGWCILGIKRIELTGRMFMDYANVKADQPSEPRKVTPDVATAFPAAPKMPPLTEHARRIGDNYGGGQVTYYSVDVDSPSKGTEPYHAECIDIINALDMNFSEGEAFKSIWRCAAHRHPGLQKQDGNPLRDAQKVEYYGKQMQAVEKGRNGRMAPK